MVFILMGVSGCGKTTIGRMLADRMALPFLDADDFHSQNNIDKMKKSVPLADSDREPWLVSIARQVSELNAAAGGVLACSALKKKYRTILSQKNIEKVMFIYLKGSKRIIQQRMKKRKSHFFGSGLLGSQFDALEEPDDAVTVSVDKPPEKICAEILDKLAGLGVLSG